jgi:uncharacterized protein (TIGR03643 family)
VNLLNNLMKAEFARAEADRIIEMAWEDRTPFAAIAFQFGLAEKEVVELMRNNSRPSSFRMWRRRITAYCKTFSSTHHAGGLKCSRQCSISMNTIIKRK